MPLNPIDGFGKAALALLLLASGAEGMKTMKTMKRIPTQFIAALGDPKASSGGGAKSWGLWRVDPGPRGVPLGAAGKLEASLVAPAGWKFDPTDWWVEEHGLVMEPPEFPMPAGNYVVTGDREVTTWLTVGTDGSWELAEGTLYDVTHLPCRAARYTPAAACDAPSPTNARLSDFPVTPGATMPRIDGYTQQDYAVLFVVGIEG